VRAWRWLLIVPLLASCAAPSQAQPTPAATRVPLAAAAPRQPTSPPLATVVPTSAAPAATPAPLPTLIPTAPPPTAAPTPAAFEATRDLGYVPILMYHYIRSVDEAADPLGFRLSVTAEGFAEQLAYLNENGYTPVTMGELARCLRAEAECPPKLVVLTFDDGYEDAFSAALPLLRQYGFAGTFYVVPNFVGRPGYLSWEQVRALHEAGMEIGSHTMNHPDLSGLSLEAAQAEIVESRRVLEEQIGAPVLSFSYPAGSYTPEIAALVRDAGYSNAVTTSPTIGFGQMFELARRRVLGGESIAGYPWYLQPLQ
jgi:peptidoglycan/xylan/chitin deacetylase (PgdA/CDA1 family)